MVAPRYADLDRLFFPRIRIGAGEMDPVLMLRRLWGNETVWRFVDALAPRGFSFLMHTYLIWHFGADSYALPAWIITTFGLVGAFIPDPSGYVLLARDPSRAYGRARLFSSWLFVKMLIGLGVTLAAVFIFASPLLATAPSGVAWILAGGLAFSMSETLWSACSLNRFAMGTLASWAQLGLILRASVLTVAVIVDSLFGIGIGLILLLFSTPLLLACLVVLPRPLFNRRSQTAGLFALGRYSLWTQMNGFLLAMIGQAPIFLAGTIPALAPAITGQLAYSVRILNLLVQPLMILQSVIVRDYARAGTAQTTVFRLYRLSYRGAGVAVFIVTVGLAWLLPSITPALWLIGGGLALFTAFRYEFALLNALRDVRFMTLRVFLPVMLIFALLIVPAHDNLLGVAFAVAMGHLLLTILLVVQTRRRITGAEGTA
jgi:hypothetical protein